MTQQTKRLSRRSFLLAAGAGSAATAAAIAGSKMPATKRNASVPGKRDTRGYHASEHVNSYYRTTKV